MISPGEHLQWLWGQPALQGQHGVPKYVGEGVPMCSHCQAETGGTLFSVGMVAFVIGGSFPAHRHWLLASGWSPRGYMWPEAAACPLALGKTYRNY